MVYKVGIGDTLYSISKNYYGKAFLWRFIALVNFKLNPNNLYVGEYVWIPFIKQLR